MNGKYWILLTLPILMLASCDKDRSLKRNALQYAQAMADYNLDEAYPYATQETQQYTLDYFKMIIPLIDSSYIASNTPATLTLDSVVHVDDTSATVYFHKKTPLQPRVDASVGMRLRDGKWLAHQLFKPAPFLTPSTPMGYDSTAVNMMQKPVDSSRVVTLSGSRAE